MRLPGRATRPRTAEPTVRVLDEAPWAWILLEAGDDLLLDMMCSHGAVHYSVTIALDEDERAAHEAQGRAYLDRLRRKVQRSAPMVVGSTSPYTGRHVGREYGDAITAAVERWRADGHRP